MIIQTKTVNGNTFNLSKYSTHMTIWQNPLKYSLGIKGIVHHVGKPAYIKRLWKDL